jgi:NhaP-type Na+/H+ or K+/H+ antiporter
MTFLILGVLGLLAIAAATAFGPRIGVATPLLLVALGIGVSLVPAFPDIEVDPEILLLGVLPPLLYSSAVSMPTMNFRREFTAISGLSVVLVVASAVILGLFFSWVIPGLNLAWGIALGAIVSPTDAVATSIVKRIGVAPRAVAILEGEGLLNDATALVALRAAIAAVTLSFSFWGVAGNFVFSVVVAVAIGFVVGKLNLWVRARVTDATVNTALSFAVPFVASLPADHFGASGLVAAVTAGLITGRGAPRVLSPQHRLSDSQNWRTVELLLEGALFLTMGLQMSKIFHEVSTEHTGIPVALGIAGVALLLTILIRAAYVVPLLRGLSKRAKRGLATKPRIATMQEKLASGEPLVTRGPRGGRELSEGRVEQFRTRMTRGLADIDYFLEAPLGWKEGTIIVWAGMRGAVTLAAAQTLPENTPERPLLVFIAFAVATGSLLIQGGTLGWLIRWLNPAKTDEASTIDERTRILALLDEAAASVTGSGEQFAVAPTERDVTAATGGGATGGSPGKAESLAILAAQRTALLDARDDGTFGAEALNSALESIDADQISVETKGAPV